MGGEILLSESKNTRDPQDLQYFYRQQLQQRASWLGPQGKEVQQTYGTGEELPSRAISCWWRDWAQGDPARCFKTNTYTMSVGYWRTHARQIISSYYFRLAILKNTGKLPQASDINIGHQDLEPLEREIRRYNLRERVKHQLTLWTRFKLQNREPSHAGLSGKGCLQSGPSNHMPFCAVVPPFS